MDQSTQQNAALVEQAAAAEAMMEQAAYLSRVAGAFKLDAHAMAHGAAQAPDAALPARQAVALARPARTAVAAPEPARQARKRANAPADEWEEF